jgi:hypothetical protein
MKIGQLKEIIADLDDDMELLTEGNDHSYISLNWAGAVTAGKIGRDYYEWYGVEHANEEEVPEDVVVISSS